MRHKKTVCMVAPKGMGFGLWVVMVLVLLCPMVADGLPPVAIHFIDVGQGDAVLVESPSNGHFLIDTGNLSTGYRLRQYLQKTGISRLEAIVVTHMHPDHVGGIFGLLPEVGVATLYDHGIPRKGYDFWEEYLNLIHELGLQRRTLTAGEKIRFGQLSAEIWNPSVPYLGNMNADSVVLRLVYGKVSLLMAADATAKTEHRLIEKGMRLKSTVLKIGHHGACDSTSELFLRQVAPEIAILSVGKDNRFGYPCDETLQRIRQTGIRLFRTDRDGTIILETDGDTLNLKMAQ